MENWHDKYQDRLSVGERAQVEFESLWRCACGGCFERVDSRRLPDYHCRKCQKRVEVKASSLLADYTISISQIPLDTMAADVIIAWRYDTGDWIGCLRRNIIIAGGPYPPRHAERGTWWYKVSLAGFRPLTTFGLLQVKKVV